MKTLRSRNIVLIMLLLGILITFELIILIAKPDTQAKASSLPTTISDSSQFRKDIMSLIREKGGKIVYADLKSQYRNVPQTQHLAAHLFGETLYETEGIDGIAVCDSSFGFGCYHGFFLRAISGEGDEAIAKLDQACIDAYGVGGLGCTHGIGHGLIEYYGHDTDSLTNALSECSQLTWKGKVLGCSSGAFMEYNFPSTVSEEITVISTNRQLDPDNPYSPCDSLTEYKESCYFELPSWWLSVLPGQSSQRAGELCSRLEENDRQFCFMGIGRQIAEGNAIAVDRTIEVCSNMPDEDGATFCMAGASWGLFVVPETRGVSEKPCQTLDEERMKTCLELADVEGMKE